MRSVRRGPVTGLTAELVLLAVLATIVGLGPLGWAVGIASGAVTSLLLARALARAGSAAMSPADGVTLARATLVGAVAALTADSFVRPVSGVALVGLTVVALVAGRRRRPGRPAHRRRHRARAPASTWRSTRG